MSAIGCHHALAAVSRSATEQASVVGARRHAGASLAISTMPGTSSVHRHRWRKLVSRAAIDIPPYALVHPEATKRRNNNNINTAWGIEPAEEGDKVKLWFQITGVGESEVKDEVEVNLPRGSNVLTIKKMKKTTNADERLDVRLLLTEDYDMTGIEVKGKKEGGKVRLEMTIIQKTTSPKIIDIN